MTKLENAHCADYTVECTATEYTSVDSTPTSDKTCAEATICRSEEYISSPEAPIQDRSCSPVLKCQNYEVELKRGGLIEQTKCTSILQWSSAWVYVLLGLPLFALLAFRGWHV